MEVEEGEGLAGEEGRRADGVPAGAEGETRRVGDRIVGEAARAADDDGEEGEPPSPGGK